MRYCAVSGRPANTAQRTFRIVPQIQFPESPRKKLVKTLLVDNDRAMLQNCVAKIGGRQPLTIATSKALAMHLLRHGHQFDVVVACEQLADGSGLALLADIQAKWPNLTRVFCTDRQRLALVRNRLSAFRLRYTLSYPVKPVKLEMMLLHLAHAKTASTARMRALLG
jgi:DNA-binding NtrC family response regulator